MLKIRIMRILFVFVFLLIGLVSCGDATKEKQAKSTVKIGDLEVMTEDLGEMSWEDAKKACAELGDGWRLPTDEELNILYENKAKIGGFASGYYWSSTEYDDGIAWGQDFYDGYQDDSNKDNDTYVRAVRAF